MPLPDPQPDRVRAADLPPIVALCGPAGVGKSTLARTLAALATTIAVPDPRVARMQGDSPAAHPALHLPTEGIVLPLAGPLKAMLRAMGVPEDHLTGSQKDQPCDVLCGRTARHAMQSLGTEWGRECIHPELWLRAWEHHARSVAGAGRAGYPYSLIVVDDLRFDNERVFLQRLGAVVLRVFRGGVHYTGEHASERGPATYHGGIELADGDACDLLARDHRNAETLLRTAVEVDARRARPTGQPGQFERVLSHGCANA